MKTKIKFLLLCTFGILFSVWISDVHAHFYGTHSQSLTGISNCSPDAEPDLNPPPGSDLQILPGDTGYIQVVQARVVGTNLCEYWDSTAPTASSLSYANATTNGWQNSTTINLSWSAVDTGGSGLKNYDIRVYRITNAQGTPTVLYTTIIAATTTNSYSYTGLNGYAYKFEVIPHDVAGNIGALVTSSDIARIDTTPPLSTSLSSVTNPQLLAINSQIFSFTYPDDGGSPVRIVSKFEDFNNSTQYLAIANSPLFSWAFSSNQNISLVDGSDRIADGGAARQYTYQLTQICDQAGNCWNGTRDYNYNVYANPNITNIASNTQDASGLIGAIADGISHSFVHIIKDGYGNAIIPASGISRVINMTLSGITNSMYLDQYSRSGPTSVYLTAPNNAADESLNFMTNQSFTNPMVSSNGTYPLNIKSYTPTATGYALTDPISDPMAAFGFTTNLTINDTLIGPPKIFSQTLTNPSFTPLYTTIISGDLRDGGFIEGTEQISDINILDNNLAFVSPSSVQLQLEFSGSDSSKFNMYGGTNTGSTTLITSKNTMVSNPGFTSTGLHTKLTQKPGLVDTGSNLQLSTHFSYTLDSKPVIYNSDMVGKDGGYWSGSGITVGNQVGIKVIGPIASNSILAIINDQFATETSIFNGLSRVIMRDKIRKSITTAMRNITTTSVSNTVNSLSVLATGGPANGSFIQNGSSSIMGIEQNGGKITLNLVGSITGRRTLVIKGADLYITSNMYYNQAVPNSILGVVVQKNELGQGGNLYINPNVTNIVGTYVIDGSIMSSSDGINPIGTSNISELKNQLYIYGSIVSENTIGGSRMSPVRCPNLINAPCTTIDEAQKYDLNYLRRYYLYDGIPFGGISTSVIGGATFIDPITISTPFNLNLIKKFDSTTEDLARYPVIIEYNPGIRNNPPIGFE